MEESSAWSTAGRFAEPHSITSLKPNWFVSKKSRYTPGNTVFTFAGHVDHDACVARVEEIAGGMRRRKKLDCQPVTSDVPQEMISLESRDIEQAHLAIGFRTFGHHSRPPLRVACAECPAW